VTRLALLALLSLPLSAPAADFDCVIEPKQVIEVRSPIEGLIERVNVDRGDRVRKGQELVVLDTSVERAQAAIARQRAQMDGAVRSGESRVDFSSKKYERAQNLHGQSYLSAQARDEAATEKRLAESELREAHDNRKLAALELQRQLEIIRLKTIRSPISGIVVERMQHPGELAEAGVGRKPILKLAEIEVLHVEVLLPAAAYGSVKHGMEVEVVPEISPGTRHVATVKVIDQLLDAASGTFGVRLELPNKQQRLAAGIRCVAHFENIAGPDRAKAGLAPREAVRRTGEPKPSR
jgi:RND family efflux transporter MFP subunit